MSILYKIVKPCLIFKISIKAQLFYLKTNLLNKIIGSTHLFPSNKKVLLRERKRHTARRVVSTPSVVLTGYHPPRGGVPDRVPPRGGYPDPPWGGGYPDPPGGYLTGNPLGGYPDPPRGVPRPPRGVPDRVPPGGVSGYPPPPRGGGGGGGSGYPPPPAAS